MAMPSLDLRRAASGAMILLAIVVSLLGVVASYPVVDAIPIEQFSILAQIDAALFGLVFAASLVAGQVASRNNPRLLAGALTPFSWVYLALFVGTLVLHFTVLSIPQAWGTACFASVCFPVEGLKAASLFFFLLTLLLILPYGQILLHQLRPEFAVNRIERRCKRATSAEVLTTAMRDLEAYVRGSQALGHPQALKLGLHAMGRVGAEVFRKWEILQVRLGGRSAPGNPARSFTVVRKHIRNLSQSFLFEPDVPLRLVSVYRYVGLSLAGDLESEAPREGGHTSELKEAYNSICEDLFYLAQEALLVGTVPTLPRFAVEAIAEITLAGDRSPDGFAFRAPTGRLSEIGILAADLRQPLVVESSLRALTKLAAASSTRARRLQAVSRLRSCVRILAKRSGRFGLRFYTLSELGRVASEASDAYLARQIVVLVGRALRPDSALAQSESLRALVGVVSSLARRSGDLKLNQEVYQMLEENAAPLIEELEDQEGAFADLRLSLLGALISAGANGEKLGELGKYVSRASRLYAELGDEAPNWIVGQLGWLAAVKGSELPQEVAEELVNGLALIAMTDIEAGRSDRANGAIYKMKKIAEDDEMTGLAPVVFAKLEDLFTKVAEQMEGAEEVSARTARLEETPTQREPEEYDNSR